MNRYRAVSLFSNCGAGDLGYKQAGFSFEVMAELDPRRLEVCQLNHPEAAVIPGDIRKTWRKVVMEYRKKAGDEAPALLCACPPCQGMSSARSGKGKHEDAAAGSKDSRNLLVTVVVKVTKQLMPSILVVENVPAFFSRKVYHPRDGSAVSAANFLVSQLAKDYEAFPLVGDLCDFGIPQSRNRAFLTFVRKDVIGLKRMLQQDRAPFPLVTHATCPVTLEQAFKVFSLPPLDAVSKERASHEGFNGLHSVPVWNQRVYDMVSAIPKGLGRSAWQNDTCGKCGYKSSNASELVCRSCQTLLPKPIVQQADGSYRLVRGFKSSYRRMHIDRPAATVTTASGHVGSDYTIHPTENRLLSPLECAMLQTFPSDFKWGLAFTKVGATHVREMIGEAVPPAFTKLHGRVLLALLKGVAMPKSISVKDFRVMRGWEKLEAAAAADGRRNPKRYASYLADFSGKKIRKSDELLSS